MRKVIDHDPATGISHVLYHDESEGLSRYVAEQDVTKTLDLNRKQANDAGKRFGELTHVARVPNVVLLDLKKKGILDDWNALKRWLNDPDNRYFRTHEGSL
jgi:hypothetical protein